MEFSIYCCVCMPQCLYVEVRGQFCGVNVDAFPSTFFNWFCVNSGHQAGMVTACTHWTTLWTQNMDVLGNWNIEELPGALSAGVTRTWVLHWPWEFPAVAEKESLPRHAQLLSSPQREAASHIHRALSRTRSKAVSTAWVLVRCKVRYWALRGISLLCFCKSHKRCAHRQSLQSLFV